MAINIISVSDEDVEKALRIEEGHFAELKGIAVAPGKLTRSLSAFANADGGELFVGIAEGASGQSHRWEGFADSEDANGHIQAFENVFPLGGDHRYEFLKSDSQPGLVPMPRS